MIELKLRAREEKKNEDKEERKKIRAHEYRQWKAEYDYKYGHSKVKPGKFVPLKSYADVPKNIDGDVW